MTVTPAGPTTEKAQLAITALTSAGLQVPFGFDQDQAADLWAGPIDAFPVADITAAVGMWVMSESKFPTLGEFVQTAQKASRIRRDEDEPLDAECPECEGIRYVTVTDGMHEVETFASKKRHRVGRGEPWEDDGDPENREYVEIVDTHKRPCSRCLPDRYDLHQRGHWDKDHEPCPQCMRYRDPARWRGVLKRAPAA